MKQTILVFILILSVFSLKNIQGQQKTQFLQETEEVPLYLAIVVPNEEAKPQVQHFLAQNHENLLLTYSEFSEEINNDFNQVQTAFEKDKNQAIWRFPDTWHTTVLYIGSDMSQLDTKYYKNFKPGQKVLLKSSTLVYVPNKIMCTPVFPKNVDIQNKVPHITLMQGEWNAVNCNSVLEAVFGDGSPLEAYYDKLQDENLQIIDHIPSINIKGEDVQVFIIKINIVNQLLWSELDFIGINENVYQS